MKENKIEIAARIIDELDDFLNERGIVIPNNERDAEDDPNASNIWGDDYYTLEDAILDVLNDDEDEGESAEVYVLERVTSQSDYTEPDYWMSAEDAIEIIEIYDDEETANQALQELKEQEALEENEGCDNKDGDDDDEDEYEAEDDEPETWYVVEKCRLIHS